MKKIVIGIVLAFLLIALIVAGTFLYQSINSDYKGSNYNAEKKDSKKERNNGTPPKIDVLSQQFSTEFMNNDVRHGYHKVKKGEHKDSVEEKFGESQKEIEVAGANAIQYGDIAVHFNNQKVDRFFIIPNNITLQQFIQVHGTRTINYNEGTMIYDDNPNNKFSVKVYIGNDGKINGVESTDQFTLNK